MCDLGCFAMFFLGVEIVGAGIAGGGDPDPQHPGKSDQYATLLNELDQFADLLNRGDYGAAKTTLQRSYDAWRKSVGAGHHDSAAHDRGYERFRRMLETLGTGDPRDEALGREFERLALRHANELPIQDEFEFAGSLMPPDADLPPNAFAAARVDAMRACCHYLARLRREADAQSKLGKIQVAPEPIEPPELGASVVSPDAIKDPARRAAYERALQEHSRTLMQSIKLHERRETLRKLQAELPALERSIADAYRHAPATAPEMTGLLQQHHIDAATIERIEGQLHNGIEGM